MKAKGIGWGKLYIAGEYAVVHPGHPAVIMATQRCIRVSIESSTQFILKSANSNRELIFDDLSHSDQYWKYAVSALNVFYRLLKEKRRFHSAVSITIESDLDSEDGRKLGLGSSGAITAAIIKGLNQLYLLNLDSISIFKLCVISQSQLKVSGSYGDLAASVFGGIIRYTRFADFDMSGSISDLIESDWAQLSISYIDYPFELHWAVGWTGEPVSTQSQVDWVNEYRNNEKYVLLLNQSKSIVNEMIDSVDVEGFLNGIRQYRNWLNQLEILTDLTIETPLIKAFIEVSNQYNGYGKSSGAGGGDCAIAFFPHALDISDILIREGIMPLTITIAKREVV